MESGSVSRMCRGIHGEESAVAAVAVGADRAAAVAAVAAAAAGPVPGGPEQVLDAGVLLLHEVAPHELLLQVLRVLGVQLVVRVGRTQRRRSGRQVESAVRSRTRRRDSGSIVVDCKGKKFFLEILLVKI